MAGQFKLVMFGNPLQVGSANNLVNMLRTRLGQFSHDHNIDVIHFARITYRIVVTGTPDNFVYLDNVMKAVKLYIPRYFTKWDFEITVNFRESRE